MDNSQFLAILKKSFLVYLRVGKRSSEKLKDLHGAISRDIIERLNNDKYTAYSMGYDTGKEHVINGRYYGKLVDITIAENEVPIAGIAVKYVMSNYLQNSNNYFENMLGETANIRSANIPYFQIFVIPDRIPYFKNGGVISKWEKISQHNLDKYVKLSEDNTQEFMHAPNKTLLFIVHIKGDCEAVSIHNKQEYADYYQNHDFEIVASDNCFSFGKSVVYNDYDAFMEKICYAIKSV